MQFDTDYFSGGSSLSVNDLVPKARFDSLFIDEDDKVWLRTGVIETDLTKYVNLTKTAPVVITDCVDDFTLDEMTSGTISQIACDNVNDELYVLESALKICKIFSIDGTYLRDTSDLTLHADVDNIIAIAVSEDKLYGVNGPTVYEFELDGTYIRTMGDMGNPSYDFHVIPSVNGVYYTRRSSSNHYLHYTDFGSGNTTQLFNFSLNTAAEAFLVVYKGLIFLAVTNTNAYSQLVIKVLAAKGPQTTSNDVLLAYTMLRENDSAQRVYSFYFSESDMKFHFGKSTKRIATSPELGGRGQPFPVNLPGSPIPYYVLAEV